MNLLETDISDPYEIQQKKNIKCLIKCITNPCSPSVIIINQITVNQCWCSFMIHLVIYANKNAGVQVWFSTDLLLLVCRLSAFVLNVCVFLCSSGCWQSTSPFDWSMQYVLMPISNSPKLMINASHLIQNDKKYNFKWCRALNYATFEVRLPRYTLQPYFFYKSFMKRFIHYTCWVFS